MLSQPEADFIEHFLRVALINDGVISDTSNNNDCFTVG